MRTFAEEVAAARPGATAVARRLVGDEAEDVVQEAVLRAYLSLSQLRDPSRFAAWLTGIAVNVAKMRLRRLALERRLAVPSNNLLQGESEREVLELVRDAVEELPPGQREVVLLHYVDGLTCDEIAELLDRSPGAVRVRLHRARAQLRRELAPLAATPPQREEREMVELTLEDVLVREPAGEPGPPMTCIILLREADGERRLPIWIGTPEGFSLAYRLHDAAPPRPMTSDLMAELVRATGARVERVAITSLREQTFYATIALDDAELDARPSDAINLAVRVGAPIVVAEDVLAQAGIEPDDLQRKLDEKAAEAGYEQPPGEWRSVTAALIQSTYPRPR